MKIKKNTHITMGELYEEIKVANQRISKYVRKTPLDHSISLSDDLKNVYLKLECQQRTKSFKIRGASNKILSLNHIEKAKGVITVSSGNHGAAVSYIANQEKIENAIIIVPSVTPKSKVDKIKAYGSQVMIVGDNYDEAHGHGMAIVDEKEMTFIDAYDKDHMVYAGQGTIGLEILEEFPDIDTVLVPVGGGGLITGISAAVKGINPNIKVIGVQTEACPAMLASMKDQICYETYPIGKSLCEALVGGVGKLSYELSHETIDGIIIVEEKWIEEAFVHAIIKEKIIAEPSSVVGIAAMMHCKDQIQGKNIAIVVSGGNVKEDLIVDMIKKYSS